MIEVKVNKKNDLLVLTFKDNVDKKQAEDLFNNVLSLAPRMQKDFKVLSDLSLLTQMHLDAHYHVESLMDMLNQHGVSKVIRIIPDSSIDIGFNIMSLFHYSSDVKIHTYKTFEDAVKYNLLTL